LRFDRRFQAAFTTDLIVRSAYQMGKTPLLPIFAASLGARDIVLGLVASVSTLTGVLFEPIVGSLSDRAGRRRWLLIGAVFFVGMPFVYRFITTPEQLVAVRVIHGMATAIYTPVSLAYVAEISRGHEAERMGWYAMARGLSNVFGPLVAGWLLLGNEPSMVFTIIGLMSIVAFLPVALMDEAPPSARGRVWEPIRSAIRRGFLTGARTPAVWLAGAVDASVLIGLYAAKVFLPIHALGQGASTLAVGAFFALQELTYVVLGPIGGRIGDRLGHRTTVGVGVGVTAVAMASLAVVPPGLLLAVPAVLIGVGQALVLPVSLGLVSASVDPERVGAGLGIVGSLKGGAKVAGPLVAGALIRYLDFAATFGILAALLLLGAAALMIGPAAPGRRPGRPRGSTRAGRHRPDPDRSSAVAPL
jgi:MFS family permease